MRRRGGSEQPVKGRRVNRSKARKASIAAPSTADLQKQVGILTRQLKEAREQQTATAEVLQVINSSPGDLAPVFDAILEKATRLCGAGFGTLWSYDGERFSIVATHALPAALAEFVREPVPAAASASVVEIVHGQNYIHVPDMAASELYHAGNRVRRAYVDLGGARTLISVALRKDSTLLGAFNVYRKEVRPFSDKEIALVQDFAAQAVIAMENARLLTEHREALERQTATAEVLQVINSSPGDLTPVFDAILEKAHGLCGVSHGSLQLYDGEKFRAVAVHALSEALAQRLRQGFVPGPKHPSQPLLKGERFAHAPDLGEIDDPLSRAAFELSGIRTVLLIPLRKDGSLLGQIVAARQEVRPFTEKEIVLLENFAAQAVIAMENARLLTEQREALERQTATAEVLEVINASTGDLTQVFDVMLEKAMRLCEAAFGGFTSYDGERFHTLALRGLPPEVAETFREPWTAGPGSYHENLVQGESLVHADLTTNYDAARRAHPQSFAVAEIGGARTGLFIALRKDDTLLGSLWFYRKEVRPFSDKQIALVQNFAAQAVVAMENARLLDEIRHRNDELGEALEFQTATGEVLRIVASSPDNLQSVFDTMLEKAIALCDARFGTLFLHDGKAFSVVADRNLPPEYAREVRGQSFSAEANAGLRRLVESKAPLHITDMFADASYTRGEPLRRAAVELGGVRSLVAVPLLKKGELIGCFSIYRDEPGGFAENQVALVATFADQAVIAIENARLFEELRDRQAELRVTFDNMGDGVVMFGADARLVAWNRNFQEILDLPEAFLAQRPSYVEYFRYLAERGEYSADLEAELSRRLHDTDQELRLERTRPDGRVIEARRNPVPGGGFVLIYADITERKRAEEAIRAARDAAEAALRNLQAAQARLVHAQKMAALGQLTAGIAHEIKNPLNFVNNFAGLSVELLEELKHAAAQATGAFDADKRAEIFETIGMLTGNLEKIAEHGRRADGIVRGMLQHSRGSSGDWQATDLNRLVEETLNLAYHGARAQDQNFNVALERDLDRNLAPIDVVPQDVSRVLLNLISNGFYAVTKRGREGDGAFRPLLKIATREFGEGVEIRVRDNGVGIPPEYREKLFQPFFTTKPTGEGTGLGLSISYEIITQQHGGTITVDSEVGDFAEFTVRLPRRRHAMALRTG